MVHNFAMTHGQVLEESVFGLTIKSNESYVIRLLFPSKTSKAAHFF